MLRWHDAHIGIRAVHLDLLAQRLELGAGRFIERGTSAGGGGGGVPRMFCSTYLPRITGDVRVG